MKDSPAVILYDAAGNPVGVELDGSIHRLQAQTKIIRAYDGAQINPATQETLEDIKAHTDYIPSDPSREGGNLATLAAKDFATETTLLTRATQTTAEAVQSALEDIRDVGGIKKITDQLPAGTNEVGLVAQGTRASASGAWPEYLVDSAGNVVGVVLDGSVYRLQADSKVARGATSLVHLDVVDTTAGKGRLKSTLYTQDGDPVTFGSVPPNPASIRNDFARNMGSDSLLVDGSVTPVVFTYPANATYDISIQEIKFVVSANTITFGGGAFGSRAGPLPNGVLVEIVAGGNTGVLYNLDQNESFVNFASSGGFYWTVSNKDMLCSDYLIGGGLRLTAGSADMVRVTVRDQLSSPTSAGLYFKCFVKGNLLPVS